MKKYPIFVFSIFCLTSSIGAMVTNRGEWSIFSPSLPRISTSESPQYLSTQEPITLLRELGQQADEVCARIKNSQEFGPLLQERFNAVQKDLLIAVIDQILSDEQLLESVTKASYRNVTGFLKIVLVDGGKESWKIRLHVWDQKEEKEFPHNHKWDFFSKIITGYLTQELYTKVDASAIAAQRCSVREPVSLMPLLPTGELPCPCRDNYVLTQKDTDTPEVALKVADRDIIGRGESYCMPYHLIHAITPGKGAISLVFTTRVKNSNSEVFVPLEKTNTNLERHAPSVTKEELTQELIRVKDLLQQLQVQERYLPEITDQKHRYFSSTDQIYAHEDWKTALHFSSTKKQVIQVSAEDRKKYIITADHDGHVCIGEQTISQEQEYLFVVVDDVMYASPKDFHHHSDNFICHTSFTDYGPAQSAGVMHVNVDGSLKMLEAYSGHYAPSPENMRLALAYLTSIGINTANTIIKHYEDRI